MTLALVFAVIDSLGGWFLLRHSRRPGQVHPERVMVVGWLLLLIGALLSRAAWKADTDLCMSTTHLTGRWRSAMQVNPHH